MTPALSIRGLHKRFGRFHALNGLNLELAPGAVCGLIGPNGAGKTTLMLTCGGLLRADRGEVSLLGDGPFDPVRHAGRVALLPQDSAFPPDSTPGEMLVYFGRLQGLAAAAAVRAAADMLEAVHLADRAGSPIRTLSHGMRKRLMVAQCFLGNPALVLLDEPLNGLDPVEAARVRDYIQHRRGGAALLISSHNLVEIERLCDCAVFMDAGRTVRADSMAALTRREAALNYELGGKPPPPLDALRAALPEVLFEFEKESRLVCRWEESRYTPEHVNRTVLKLLLDAGVDILALRRGEVLEREYLRQHQPR